MRGVRVLVYTVSALGATIARTGEGSEFRFDNFYCANLH
jgi:hypothetical protein